MNRTMRLQLTCILLLVSCLDEFELPAGPDPAVPTGGTENAPACGVEGAECCVAEAEAACRTGLRCDEATQLCVDEEPRLCTGESQCHPGQTCCPGGLLGTCLSLAPGGACPAPDLTIRTTQETLSFSVEPRVFAPETSAADACAIEKGCIGGSGLRYLLRFSIEVENQGDGDLLIGAPETSSAFTTAACDGQRYFPSYLTYELFDIGGVAVPGTLTRVPARCQDLPPEFSARFNCEFWGLWSQFSESFVPSAPSADPAAVDCQWVDVTGLSEGEYVLRVTVNPSDPEPVLDEPTLNNTRDFSLSLPALSQPTSDCPTIVDNSVNPVGGSSLFEAGLARECGWEFVATALASDCSPGETVVLSCPSCDQTSEDPMLRVCEGNRACVAQTALAAADDTFAVLDAVLLTETPTTQSECEALANTDPFRYSCYTSSPCPTVQFTCPAGGVYTALSASEDPNAAAACEATRPAAASPDAGL